MLNIYLLLAVAASALAFSLVRAARCPVSKIPGPWYSRFTRLVLKYHILAGREMYHLDDLHRRHGPVVRIAPGEVAVADLAAYARIHRVGSPFLKGPWYDSVNPGIFALRDPKRHGERRRLFARAFSKTALRANWEAAVRRTVEKTMGRIKAEAEAEGGSADVLKWWTLMATDVIAHLSFGESFDMVGLGRTTPYVNAIQSSLLSSGLRWELPLLHAVARRLPVRAVQEVVNCEALIARYSGKAVRNLRESGRAQNLFSQIVALSASPDAAAEKDKEEREAQSHHLSDLSVRLEATNLIVAGSDTTASTMTYLVWAVLKRPQLQCRLEEEVAVLPAGFTEVDLEALPLLNSVIDETLRLYGAAPGALQRYVPEGGATMAGYFLPAGTVVCTQAYTMHRDGAVFEHPESFDEDRFMRPQSREQKLAFSAFGTGSRICLGIHLARMELRLATALFFRECRGARLSPDTTDAVMEMEHHFLVAPKGHFCNITLPSV
ncbi:cytochrome P450 [Apiospora aurea]|uniref:Cytochrome P450 n=1 Tax=Apiospora aurea TaxID=335848 RepID=A0ABR1Q9Q5_9PEZI